MLIVNNSEQSKPKLCPDIYLVSQKKKSFPFKVTHLLFSPNESSVTAHFRRGRDGLKGPTQVQQYSGTIRVRGQRLTHKALCYSMGLRTKWVYFWSYPKTLSLLSTTREMWSSQYHGIRQRSASRVLRTTQWFHVMLLFFVPGGQNIHTCTFSNTLKSL